MDDTNLNGNLNELNQRVSVLEKALLAAGDQKISQLTALTTPSAGDLLAIVDTGATETKNIDYANLFANMISPAQYTLYVDPVKAAIVTAPTGSREYPFATIQAALDDIGNPTSTAEAREPWEINIASGYYDEDLSVPAGRWIKLIAHGAVTLGDSDVPSTPRDVTINIDSTKEYGSLRPLYVFCCNVASQPDTARPAKVSSFIVSGDFIITSNAGVASQADIVLDGIKISGIYQLVDGGVAVNDSRLYAKNVFFDNNTTSITDAAATGGIRINELYCCETDGAIVCERIESARFCDLNDDITVTSLPSGEMFPQGFFACDFHSHTFTGPASSFIIDSACHNLPTLAGGATKVMVSDSEIVNYDNSGSTLVATDVEAALDELDGKIVASNEFSELLDVSGAYTTAYALYAVNATTDGLQESTTLLTQPAANQFQLTRGTTDFLVTADCTINQNLSTSSYPSFQNIGLTAAGSAQISVNNNLLIEADDDIQLQCTDNIILNTPNATIVVNSTATGIGINTDSLNIVIGTSSAGNINLTSAAQINLTPDPLSAINLNGPTSISSGTFALPTGTTVNEIVTSISGASTDDQLPTAKAVYDLFATGDTWDEIMHNGAIFTIANTENLSATINQNDTTNNPAALVITNTGSGNDVTLPGLGIANGVLSGSDIVLNATGAGASVSNSTGIVISTTSLPVTINTNTTSDITVSSAADLLMSGASGVSISSSSGSIDITSNTLFDFATSGSITFPVYAKVVFRGDTTDPNDSATCAWYTTDDNTYPCMTMSAYKDGEQYIAFGAYLDAAFNWVSTHATSNYAIERTSTELQFYGDTSIAKGSTINFDTMMAFNASTQEVKSTYIYNTTVTSTRDVEVEADGTLGYVSSLRKHKMNINPVIDYEWLLKAPVCSFNYKKKHPETKKFTEDPDDELCYGFIAEEIEKLNKDFVFYDVEKNDDGEIIKKTLAGINYKKMIPVLVKIVQDHERQLNKIH